MFIDVDNNLNIIIRLSIELNEHCNNDCTCFSVYVSDMRNNNTNHLKLKLNHGIEKKVFEILSCKGQILKLLQI